MKNTFINNELVQVLKTFKREFIAVGLFSMVVNLLMITPTLYMLQVYDRVMLSRSDLTLITLSLVALFFYVISAVSEALRSRLLVRAGVKFDLAINDRIFQAGFQERLKGRLPNPGELFADLTYLRQFLTGNGIFAFFDAPWAPIYVAVSYLMHPVLGHVSLFFTVILTGMAFYSQKISKDVNEVSVLENGKETEYLQSKLRNGEVIESMGMLTNLRVKWLQKHAVALAASERSQEINHRLMALTKFMQYTQQSLILGVGALLVIDGELSPGAMVAANFLVGRALQPIQMMVSTWRTAAQTKISFDRLGKLLEDNPVRSTRITTKPSSASIDLMNLVVSAPKRTEPILKGLNAQFKSGDVVVIMGPSGSGKSTLVRSILGIWPYVESGEVLLDGKNIQHWDREILGPEIGYLPQDIELLDGTIAENIARFSDEASEPIIEAAMAVGIHDTILRLPQGYDTPIGEAGNKLSGGQRQRLALARAVYGKPMLMVLDEPNANLDDVGEKALYKTVLDARAQGKTTFIVSHRPGAIQVADVVVILEKGKIVAMGPKEEVFKSAGQNSLNS